MKETLENRALPAGARPLRLGETPSLSVVVASRGERARLEACLASLLPQAEEEGAELVVARAGEAAELAELEEAYPAVRFVPATAEATIPQLRAAGMAAAEGDIVALTEDHRVVGSDWLAQRVGAQKAGAVLAGGVMDDAQRERAIAWAAYFARYGLPGEG